MPDHDDVGAFQPLVTEADDRDDFAPAVRRANSGTTETIYGSAGIERQNAIVAAEQGDLIGAQVVTHPAPAPEVAPEQRRPAVPLHRAGDLGAEVENVLRLERVAGTSRKIHARLDDEYQTVVAAQLTAIDDHDAALVAEARTAAAAKLRVPKILASAMSFAEHTHLSSSAWHHHQRLVARVDAGLLADAAAHIRGPVLDECDELVTAAASKALADGAQAAERLRLAGMTVRASLEDVLDGGDDGVVSAIRLFRRAAARFVEVQRVRAWFAAALERGFVVNDAGKLSVAPPPKVRSGPFALDDDTGPTAEEKAIASIFAEPTRSHLGDDVSAEAMSAFLRWLDLPAESRPTAHGLPRPKVAQKGAKC